MRDPRVDPRPGDRVIYGPQWQSEPVDVTEVGSETIWGKINGHPVLYSRKEWEKWMKDAEVLRVAD